jgi:hypothetical protein
MNFKEFAEAVYPVGKPFAPPPISPSVNPSDPQTWSKKDYWRVHNGDYNPPELAIVKKQKRELAKQREELGELGVIFTPITPFKLNGGVKLTDNPIWSKLG